MASPAHGALSMPTGLGHSGGEWVIRELDTATDRWHAIRAWCFG